WTKRSEGRENSRWTLKEWLAQKERNQMMDIWLAMNSPSPYELSLQGGYSSYQKEQILPLPLITSDHKTYRGSLSAYAQIFGLTLDYENNTEENFNDLAASFNLRLLGNSLQNSHLTLSYGQRTRENQNAIPTRLLQQFADVNLNFHFSRHFGLIGNYRSFIPTTSPTLGEVSGHTSKVGVFIDYGIVRIYGQRVLEIDKTNVEIQRTGIESGLQFYF
ncbi:MAG TPA: hypothetical protein PLJ21_04885, partial [Pseudobdellovibrionaceae bacterium]|nr:hypothetical protein [Pseudobdellovibrionaceae bacterium]